MIQGELDTEDIQQAFIEEIVNKIKGEPPPLARFLVTRRRVLITELREIEKLLIDYEMIQESSLVSPRKR